MSIPPPTLVRHFTVLRDALTGAGLKDPLIAFAVKANSNVAVLRTLAQAGAGADVSRRARSAARSPPACPLSASSSPASVRRRPRSNTPSKAGVAEINLESEPELHLVNAVAQRMGKRATVAIRVNPDVEAGGHAKISTGKAENKFGVSMAEAERLYANASNMAGVKPVGVACHIGSQITDLAPMETAFRKMRGLVERLRAEGMSIERLDLGGGLGAPYFNAPTPPAPADYAAMIARTMAGLTDIQFAFEPGRMIAANAGVLVARVLHVNSRPEGRKFLVLDAAMNDLLRPAMYDAFHDIRPVKPREGEAVTYDVVGPHLRDRRHLHPRPRPAADGSWRPHRLHDRRSLRRGHVQRIQLAPARARGAGEGRPVRRGAAAPDLRRHAGPRAGRALAVKR